MARLLKADPAAISADESAAVVDYLLKRERHSEAVPYAFHAMRRAEVSHEHCHRTNESGKNSMPGNKEISLQVSYFQDDIGLIRIQRSLMSFIVRWYPRTIFMQIPSCFVCG